jgi:hypothetical protein
MVRDPLLVGTPRVLASYRAPRTFKALTALVILHIQQGNVGDMIGRYRELLACIGTSRVTSNAIMDAITRSECLRTL